jgi:hypothetical protein
MKDRVQRFLLFYSVLVLLLLALVVLTCSCEVLKGKKRSEAVTKDTTKETGGGTDTSKGKTVTKEGFTREIYNYLPDSNLLKALAGKEPIVKNYYPQQPVQIIRETGNREEVSEFSKFIQWYQDKEAAKVATVVTDEKTKGTTMIPPYVWIGLLVFGLAYLFIQYKKK